MKSAVCRRSYAETPHSAGLSAGRSGLSPARRRTCQDEHARKQPPAAACARRFAAKSAPAGQRQIRNHSVPSTSARGSGETRLRRFTVNAACCADLFWIYRGSLPLSTPYSGSPIAVHRNHTAEWLFPQEKATFDRISKDICIGEPL